MSKIICDVCGTSYPEAATQCPICGCVRSANAKAVAGGTNENDTRDNGSYTYVKGGRFSKTNVRKRNSSKQGAAAPAVAPTEEKTNKKSDKGLVIAVFTLLLVIVAVVIYIVLRFFVPTVSDGKDSNDTGSNTTQSTPDTSEDDSNMTADPVVLDVPCTGLTVSKAVVEFDAVGDVLLLNVTPEPTDTTDEVTFSSDNEAVATVNADGKIEAVSGGQTVITITCGEITAQCRVVCNIEGTEITDPITPPDTDTSAEFKLNRDDFTLAAKGTSWVLYSGDIAKEEITWSSDDVKVATVENGKVVAVGPGYTTVHAEYSGTKLSCIVRCSFTADVTEEEGISGNGGVTDDGSLSTTYTISHTDVTLKVGESFTLRLLDDQKNTVDVTWVVADGSCTVSGNKVTGISKSNGTKVYVAYAGAEYSCTVRVK